MSSRAPVRVRRAVFGAGVVAQMGIVVTGGLVRLTGSGLGCPTWPQCVDGSYTPVPQQPQSFHKLIEFGNRMLTVVVLLVVVACIVAAWRRVPRRRPLVLLAGAGLLGVLAQAVLGGLTVRTGLNPYVVGAHFLVSMPLVAAALAVYERDADAGDGPPRPLVRRELGWLSRALVVVATVVLVLGTLVTGSGPHAGDDHTPRNGLNPADVAWLHADVVLVFVGLLAAMLLGLHLTSAPRAAQRRAWLLLAVTLGQGVLGYVQYVTGVPWVLVSVHVLGATVLWWAVLRLTYALRERSAVGVGVTAEPAASEQVGQG